MTLIVGIKCADGVIIGSDSAMTFMASNQFTISQTYLEKIEIITDSVILAGTGHIGLGQRFKAITERIWSDTKIRNRSAVDFSRVICSEVRSDFASTGVDKNSYGALLAYSRGRGRTELVEFQLSDLQPEVKTNENWYVSMGTGQTVADPLLGFVRETFWGDSPPTLNEGVFAMTMVLKLGCKMAPGGVAEPIQMAVLSSDKNGKVKATRLSDDELMEHRNNYDAAIEYFRSYRDKLRSKDVPDKELPPPPQTDNNA